MKLYFAPVQGHTDAAYRYFHAIHYGHSISPDKNDQGVNDELNMISYTSPFIRLEKGELRKKDLKDILSDLNSKLNFIPQVIFKNSEELSSLIDILRQEGMNRIDINMGCPFPLQTSRGRGAATVGNIECHKAVEDAVKNNPDINFSVKMRLGYDKEEFLPLIESLNDLKLDHISIHPRTSKDQYSGDLHIEAFEKIYSISKNPIVYNGEIKSPNDAKDISERYPELKGLMIGRGALARPSIFREIISGEEWPESLRRQEMIKFHRELLNFYKENLIGGDHQILSKIQPFWEYSESEIGRKAWKAIKKSTNMSKYQTALAMI